MTPTLGGPRGPVEDIPHEVWLSFARGGLAKPSTLVRFLEEMTPTPGSRVAAEDILRMTGHPGTARTLHALSGTWTFDDVRYLAGLPDGGRAHLDALAAAPALRCLRITGARWRETPMELASRLRPPRGPHRATDADIRRLLASDAEIHDETTLSALLALPRDWTPRGPAESAAARRVIQASIPFLRLLGDFGYLGGVRGRWQDYERRLKETWTGSLSGRCRSCLDFITAFERQVVRPVLMREGLLDPIVPASSTPFAALYGVERERLRTSLPVAALVLLRHKELASILDLSDRWHARRAAIDTVALPGAALGGRWPLPFPDLVAPNGVRIVGLGTPEELKAEGSPDALDGMPGLDHCVASYVPQCADGHCSIYGLRDPGRPARLSTLEIVHADGKMLPGQHMGLDDGQPPEAALEAVAWLEGEIQAERIRPSGIFLGMQAGGDGFLFDWRDPAALAGVVRAWSPLLKPSLRDPAALVAEILRTADMLVLANVPGGWMSLPGGHVLPDRLPPDPAPRRPLAWAFLRSPRTLLSEVTSVARARRARLRRERPWRSPDVPILVAALALVAVAAVVGTGVQDALGTRSILSAGYPVGLLAGWLAAASVATAWMAGFRAWNARRFRMRLRRGADVPS